MRIGPRFLLALWAAGGGLVFAAQDGPAPDKFSLALTAGFSTNLYLGRLVPLAGTADVPDVRISLESGSPAGGVEFGCALGRRFELLAAASYGRAGVFHDIGIGLAGIPLGKSKFADAEAWTFGGGLRFSLGGTKISPLLFLSGGAAAVHVRGSGTKARPYFECGAGLKARLSRRLRLVFEAGPVVTFFRYFEDFRFAYILIYRPEFHNVQTSLKARLGLAFLL
ncbi:MAG: hypothetical protein FJY80_03655 [Candidatus Aminicenantes bacterium]|nr:hypothetical protein [Candidatus Aminicenantes bacterium]